MKAEFAKFNRRCGGSAAASVSYFIRFYDESRPDAFGVGECTVVPGVSAEYADVAAYEAKLHELCAQVARGESTDLMEFSSIMYGFENAITDFSNGCRRIYYNTPFVAGRQVVPVVGFASVGDDPGATARQVAGLAAEGCTAVKLGMTAGDCAPVAEALTLIRRQCPDLHIRLDANGLLRPDEALGFINGLARHTIQCIEQPIATGQLDAMAAICAASKVPVALSDELAGVVNPMAMLQLLRTVKPHVLCVKPALCGGFSNAVHWLKMSAQLNLGCWIASAGETAVGLDALCQWTAMMQPRIAQELLPDGAACSGHSPLRFGKNTIGRDSAGVTPDCIGYFNPDWQQ